MLTTFSQEEIAIMAMYRTDTKEHLLADLAEAVPYTDDPQAAAYMADIKEKLQTISNAEFNQITFMPDTL